MNTRARNIILNRHDAVSPHAAATATDSDRFILRYRTILSDTFSPLCRGLYKRTNNLFACQPLNMSHQTVNTHQQIDNVITGFILDQRFCILLIT